MSVLLPTTHVPDARSAAPTAWLSVGGDLDMDTSAGVLADVERLLALGYREIHLDLARLRSCDVAGMACLVTGGRRAAQAGGGLTVPARSCWSLDLLLTTFGWPEGVRAAPHDPAWAGP